MTQTFKQWMSGHSNYKSRGEVGIEIETETARAYEVPGLEYWTTHQDGSLRNFGIEYVLGSPKDFNSEGYNAAMQEFADKTKMFPFLPSVYTSVHVHFNQVDRTMQQIFNFITLYMLFEETLTRHCGPDRDGNLFCLKTSNAEQNLRNITTLAEEIDRGNRRKVANLNVATHKYAGLNVAPLRNFGSLEVRTHGGTTDIRLINRWVGMLHTAIYSRAVEYSDPVAIIKDLEVRGYKAFFERSFGAYAKFVDSSHLNEDLNKTLWYATAVANSVKDWSSFSDEKKKVNPVKVVKFSAERLDFYENDEDATVQQYADLTSYYRNLGTVTMFHATEDL